MTTEGLEILEALRHSERFRHELYSATGPMSNEMTDAVIQGLESDGYIKYDVIPNRYRLTRAGRDVMDLRARMAGAKP